MLSGKVRRFIAGHQTRVPRSRRIPFTEVPCLTCGHILIHAGYKKPKYCSVACYGKALVKPGSRKRDRLSRSETEYRRIAEVALGHALPSGAEVHHVNENPNDNHNSNLVICQDGRYHKLLHRRMRIVKLGGDPNREGFCSRCKQLKSLDKFHINRVGKHAGYPAGYCKVCSVDHTRQWLIAKRQTLQQLNSSDNG